MSMLIQQGYFRALNGGGGGENGQDGKVAAAVATVWRHYHRAEQLLLLHQVALGAAALSLHC